MFIVCNLLMNSVTYNVCDDSDIKREIHIMYVNSEIQKVFTTCKDSDI